VWMYIMYMYRQLKEA